MPSTLESIGNYAFALTGNVIIKFNEKTNNDIQLKNIGMFSFAMGNIEGIKIPSSVETIGERAFVKDRLLKSLEFEGGSDETSKLKTIGKNAFVECDITSDKDNPLIIPYSVQTIEGGAFYSNFNLTKLEFAGSLTDVFDDENDEKYNLLTIGDSAFYGDGLDYSGNEELVLPARIKSIGYIAFQGNPGDPIKTSLQNIRYMGSRDVLNTFENWHHTHVTVKAYGE